MRFPILITYLDHFCQVEELVALTDPHLSLFSGDEQQFDSFEDRPQHKITNFRYLIVILNRESNFIGYYFWVLLVSVMGKNNPKC